MPEKVDLAVDRHARAGRAAASSASASTRACKGAIVISAGFKELGPPGVELERQVLEQRAARADAADRPELPGRDEPAHRLNATFAGGMARPGNVAFISQSGALLTAILDWSFKEQVGFSAFVSTGSMLDVGWGDLIDYLGNDPQTQSILIYMESIGDARAFLSAAREVALTKPIIVIKAGRTEQAAKAAASPHRVAHRQRRGARRRLPPHAACCACDNIADLFYMAEVLAKQPRPRARG